MSVLAPETLGLAPAEQDAAQAQDIVIMLWAEVLAGTLAYGAFISIAAEVVTTANLTAWQLADLAMAEAVLAGTDIPISPIGYGAPSWLTDPHRVEKQIALMLNNAVSAEVRDLKAQGAREAAFVAQDDLRERKLLRLVDNETALAYTASEGTAVQAYGADRLVDGWFRQLGAPKFYSKHGSGKSRGGASTSPCSWCVTLNGGNAIRPANWRMGVHPGDRCRRTPVVVRLEDIGPRWREGYARRLLAAQGVVREGRFGFFVDNTPHQHAA